MPQSQVAANPWHQEEEERDTNHKAARGKQTNTWKNTDQLSIFSKRGNRNAQRTEKD